MLSKQRRLAVVHEQKTEVDLSNRVDSVTNQQQMCSFFQEESEEVCQKEDEASTRTGSGRDRRDILMASCDGL